MADPLRVGFIGAGGNTTLRHLPGLLAIENVQAVAVANRSEESGRRVADQFGIARVETDPEAIFVADDIDAICIGTWPYRHREYTVRALEAGKHVLCEARMAMNATEAREMLAASRLRDDLVAQLVPAPMDLLVWRTVRRLLRENVLGQVREAHVDVVNGSGVAEHGPLHWRHQTEFSGMNVMTFGIFSEIVSRWLGATERVVADGTTFVRRRRDEATGEEAWVDVPDSLGVFAELRGGTRVTYRFSTVAHAAPPPSISVFGSEGSLFWRGGDDLTLAPVGGEAQKVTPDEGTAIGWNVEQDFVDSIRENKPVELTSFEDGLHYMRITEAVHRSREEGRSINLEEV
ncbi:MAG: Gfo/Idh/MocA family oxidoreductase [Chloroflexi bacterium]|nr:Gfo/Idh/MocA family oxidoreductase [Chloroflexota bacterium]